MEYEREILACFPEMKYIDLDSHGYNLVDVTPAHVQVDWWCVDTVLTRSDTEHRGAAFKIEAGRPVLIPAE
jgi:alkaline phosphatase D